MGDVKRVEYMLGDCIEELKKIPDNSIDSIVTDPPAGIAFMGKSWDKDKGGRKEWIAWMQSVAEECIRVIKPGGHALVWAIPRTSHWTGQAWEDAGWTPRDKIYHVFGSGFPKSLDVSKAIDKAAGVDFDAKPAEGVGFMRPDGGNGYNVTKNQLIRSGESTPEAQQWDGWGTALKPAAEEWWLFRKPLSEKTIVANVLKWGTGAINVDGCRVGTGEAVPGDGASKRGKDGGGIYGDGVAPENARPHTKGRFPANLILSYPENEYILRDDVTPEQLQQLAEWMNENAKH